MLLEDGEIKYFTAKMVIEVDYSTYLEPGEDPEAHLNVILDEEGFKGFMKDYSSWFDGINSVDVVEVVEQKE